ncbi:hypothetical protein [Paracidovorax valerianellae]|uniref:Uncharacterized protein n=1 Tax=Paracidovorax valerianellae TaxID=187868 RepID=A0A1G7FHZ0_9BURK|nr:hypothetical protein [Paracidovorax valerianellae]MDA8445191.1 hypothetical protein [Paracidovorax valerianellae]SDE75155.1 hypothetical protein SAMN05192589_1301 [Paracidovorax valerianellae]
MTMRKLLTSFTNQLHTLSVARIWTTVFMHAFAIAILFYFLFIPLDIIWITLLLLGYAFFVSALTLSLLVKLPFLRQLWEDAFFKIGLLAIPIPMLYLSKGYAALWIGEILEISAANVPMAHFAATSFFLLFAMALALSFTALIFEFSFVLSMLPKKGVHLREKEISTFRLLFSLRLYRRRSERIRVRMAQRKVGIFLLSFASFFGCWSGFNAAAAIAPGHLSRIVVSAIIFEFDAAPANRCALTPEERLKVQRDEPLVKALFLAGTQDKAILTERQKNLFMPIQFKGFRTRAETERGLSLQRTVVCHVPA